MRKTERNKEFKRHEIGRGPGNVHDKLGKEKTHGPIVGV